jgi:CBS domain containing-hemolysin-like protein
LLVLALSSAVDAAFTSVSWRRLNTMLAERATRSRALMQLLNDPYRFKATMILLNTSATIAAAGLTLELAHTLSVWVRVVCLGLLLVAILVVSAALPKMLALRDPQAIVLATAGPVSRIAWLLSPLVSAVTLLTRPVAKLAGTDALTSTPLVIEEELRSLVDAGEEQGLFEHDEREMIEGVFSFGDTIVREVLVPRVYIVSLDVNTPIDEALDTVIRYGHSRIPVYKDTIDNVVGILYAKDLLTTLRDCQHDASLLSLLRPAHFVPETIKVDALLKELQQSKVHITLVVDEYGGIAGLATIEDLIEEIVGEIQDEFDVEEPFIKVLSETEMVVDARTTIEEVRELTGLELEHTDADRIGGLVYEQLGRVPRVYDEVALEGGSISITVLSMKGVRPQKLRIMLQPRPQETELVEIDSSADLESATLPLLPGRNGNGNGKEALYQYQFSIPHELSSRARSIYGTGRLHRTYYRSTFRT